MLARVLVGCAAAVLAACSTEAQVPLPQPDATAAAACANLARLLPDQVLSQDARSTTPESDLTKAWGDPIITLRCGVDTPAELTATSQLITVNGVDWFPQELTAGYRFTTTDREANVEVSVPDAYAPEAGALVDLAQPISAAVKVTSAG